MLRRILFIFLVCIIGLWSRAFGAAVKGQISNQIDTVHVEFTGQESWDYELKRVSVNKKPHIQLAVPALDEATIQKLSNFKNAFIKNIKIEQRDGEKKSVLVMELADDDVESFDYLTDQPSRLIVDFFMGTKAPKAEKKKKESPAAAKVEVVTEEKRSPAGTDLLILKDAPGAYNVAQSSKELQSGIFDGGDPDFSRFSIKEYEIKEEAILKSKENYYIPFPMLELENNNWEKAKAAATEYTIHSENTDENKQARLLLTLFKKKRYNVYLKTLEWYKEKFPESKYNEIIAFMTGDVYYRLWQENNRIGDFDVAIEQYKDALKKFPKSVLAERISLMLGYLQLERGDNLSAIKYLNEHANSANFGDAQIFSKGLARLGVYLGYLRLSKYNEAYETLNGLEKDFSQPDLKMEAAYRKGDVFVKSKNFARAVEEYQRALMAYPQGQATLSNAYFNQGESLFLLDKYQQSLDTFKEYLRRFPSSEHAPFALTRIGELLEILGADKARVIGAYLETYFRYGESPSAIISRLRLLSARMKGMKQKEVDVTVKEILSLSQKLNLPNIQQFATVMIADGYNQRRDYDKALNLLIKYFQEHHGTVDESQLKKRIVSNINDKLREEVQAGKFIDGLKTHQKYADNWLKGTDHRLDTKYFIGKAFESGGSYQQAEKYYQDVVNSYYAALNTEKQKNIIVLEHLPTLDSLNLRLAGVTFSQGRFNRAYDQLKNIKKPELMSEEEQIERVSLSVSLLEKKGDVDSAIRYLTELLKVWQGVPTLLAQPYFNLAELEIKSGRNEDAKKSLEKVDRMMKDSGKVPTNIHSASLEKLADLYFQDKQIDKSIATYKDLLDQYEDKIPLSSIRYKLGKIFFDRGDTQKAADVWAQFKNDKSGMWEKLAKEELKNVEWQADYKKYLKRIPAMAGKSQ